MIGDGGFGEFRSCPKCGLVTRSAPLGKHIRTCVVDESSLLEVLQHKGYTNVGNYSRCWLPTRTDGRGKISGGKRAHIVSFEAVYGPLPNGLVVRHACDVGNCANPAHLEAGTQADNIRDMMDRGRGRGQFERALQRRKAACPTCGQVTERNERQRDYCSRECYYGRLS